MAKDDFDWSIDNRIARLTAMWPDKTISTAEIGRRLGTSKSSAVGKAHRLGLEGRESPIKPGAGGPPRPKRPPGSGSQAIAGDTLPALPSVKSEIALPPSAARIAPPPEKPRPIRVRNPEQCCQYPISDGRPWKFCDKPTTGLYCEDHQAIAVSKARRAQMPADEADL